MKLLASRTGGTYHGARSSAALTSIYATISAELQRTWQLQYVTAARPGDHINIKVTAPGHGSASATATVAGKAAASHSLPLTWLLIGLAVLMLAIVAFLLRPALSALAERVRSPTPTSDASTAVRALVVHDRVGSVHVHHTVWRVGFLCSSVGIGLPTVDAVSGQAGRALERLERTHGRKPEHAGDGRREQHERWGRPAFRLDRRPEQRVNRH